MSGALKSEATHVLISLGDNDDEGQNGDVLRVPQPHSSTKVFAASLHAAS